MDSLERKKTGFDLASFISLLYQWRKFLLIQVILVSIVAVTIALIIPKTYSSSATLLPPGQSNFLTSFLPQEMTRGLSSVLGSSGFDKGGESSKIMAILKSRNLAEDVIENFNLQERFEAETIEDALEAFREKISVTTEEESTIRITTSFKTDFFHPEENENEIKLLVKDISDYIVKKLDNIYTNLGTQKAGYQLEVIEKRYNQNIDDLRNLEQEAEEFSRKYGVVALPEQTEAMIQSIAQLESQAAIEEVKLEVYKGVLNKNSAELREQQRLVAELNEKIKELKLGDKSGETLSVLPAFSKIPELAVTYARLEREVTVQGLIYEFLTQQIEQLRLQKAKDTPSLQFIDTPQIPTKRSAPTRSLVAIGIFFVGMLLSIVFVIIQTQYSNDIITFVEKVKSSTDQ